MQDPLFAGVLAEAERSLRTHGRVALCQIVRVEGSTPGKVGWKLLVRPDGSTVGNLGGGAFEALVKTDALAKLRAEGAQAEVKRYYFTEQAVRGEPTGMVCGGLAEVFLEALGAPPLLVVCGGGPVGQALARQGALCGFDLLVAEDREEFLRRELFPEGARLAPVSRDYREDFLGEARGRELYAAVVTRCWETDAAALGAILRQAPPALAYLGLMGSRRKVERVKEFLAERGEALTNGRLHAPIGLPIGGDSPAEIAVSIVAEVIQVRNREKREGGETRDSGERRES
jgi:xanthine dehydrogenase accessory factor